MIVRNHVVPTYIDVGGGVKLSFVKSDIGVWNMDTIDSILINTPITSKTIVSMQAIIYNDGQSRQYSLTGSDIAGNEGGYLYIDGLDTYLERVTGGRFDNANFNDSVINRGFLLTGYLV